MVGNFTVVKANNVFAMAAYLRVARVMLTVCNGMAKYNFCDE
jgi:hypothetical protein